MTPICIKHKDSIGTSLLKCEVCFNETQREMYHWIPKNFSCGSCKEILLRSDLSEHLVKCMSWFDAVD